MITPLVGARAELGPTLRERFVRVDAHRLVGRIRRTASRDTVSPTFRSPLSLATSVRATTRRCPEFFAPPPPWPAASTRCPRAPWPRPPVAWPVRSHPRAPNPS